ncbi:tocopherol cyclase family protein [Subdoligranulum variabile]|uniref:tocopherol cyclase family protein n=2 Tax=Subdoligranulum variabile TaxID=214851 RepID=UPI0026F2FE7F|nr:tocopherol cyclase family protein [Subdoligranulum variabile]
MRRQKGFAGWYFKHQKGDAMVAFIPGRAQSGAFVQMISPEGSRQFAVSHLSVRGGVLRADGCRFSRRGCRIRLPGVRGEIRYGSFASLGSDIMGPFRFFPMECRHGVLSMAHSLWGSITAEGRRYDFDGGLGYAETDSGTSFPRSYLWMQCNDFPEPCSLMIAIARIPFCGLAFRGCICAILYRGKEYRLATYRGVRICSFSPEHIRLSQGSLSLELDVCPAQAGHPLRAPKQGKMSSTIRESCNAHLRARLTQGGKTVFDLQSDHGVYEFVPEPQPGQEGIL